MTKLEENIPGGIKSILVKIDRVLSFTDCVSQCEKEEQIKYKRYNGKQDHQKVVARHLALNKAARSNSQSETELDLG